MPLKFSKIVLILVSPVMIFILFILFIIFYKFSFADEGVFGEALYNVKYKNLVTEDKVEKYLELIGKKNPQGLVSMWALSREVHDPEGEVLLSITFHVHPDSEREFLELTWERKALKREKIFKFRESGHDHTIIEYRLPSRYFMALEKFRLCYTNSCGGLFSEQNRFDLSHSFADLLNVKKRILVSSGI